MSQPISPTITSPVAEPAPRQLEVGVLEESALHHLLVGLNRPAGWPPAQALLVVLAAIVVTAALGWLVAGSVWAQNAALLMLLFTLLDAGILLALPAFGLSFGPFAPQLFLLAIPRLVLWLIAAPLAGLLGATPLLIAAGGLNLLASVAFAWGALVEPASVRVTRATVRTTLWPAGAPPVRLLQIGDLHVERFGRREAQVVRLAQDLEPDIIVLTGDYLSLSRVDDPAAHADARRLLSQLSAPAGVYAVLGSPPVDRNSIPMFDGLPIHLLRRHLATLSLGLGRRLALIGLDCTHDPDIDAARVGEIAAGAPSDALRVLLLHSPDVMPRAPAAGIGLYLCGHTHGGQIRLPGYGALITSSKLGKRFEMGHYELGSTQLYVSRGVGLEGMGAPRVRFLCRPEIVLWTIAPAQSSQPAFELIRG